MSEYRPYPHNHWISSSDGAPSQKTRILFVAEPLSLGHVVRPLVLARSLDPRRYDVHFATGHRFLSLANRSGITPHVLDSVTTEAIYQRMAAGKPLYGLATLRRYVRDDLALFARTSPHLVVGDFRLSLDLSSRVADLPFLNLINAYWSPHATRPLPLPDLPATRVLGRTLSRLLLPTLLRCHAAVHNRLRREWGFERVDGLFEAYTRGTWTLYPDLPQLLPTKDLPAHHAYLGPILWEPEAELPLRAERAAAGPRVYVSAGARSDLQALAEAGVRDAGASVLAARGGELVPGIQAAGLSDLVVCHGGSGSVYQALSRGVPVVGLVSNPDQMLSMQAVEMAGAGISLPARRTSRADVTAAVALALKRPSLREAAEGLGALIAATDAPGTFAVLLDQHLDPRAAPTTPVVDPPVGDIEALPTLETPHARVAS